MSIRFNLNLVSYSVVGLFSVGCNTFQEFHISTRSMSVVMIVCAVASDSKIPLEGLHHAFTPPHRSETTQRLRRGRQHDSRMLHLLHHDQR